MSNQNNNNVSTPKKYNNKNERPLEGLLQQNPLNNFNYNSLITQKSKKRLINMNELNEEFQKTSISNSKKTQIINSREYTNVNERNMILSYFNNKITLNKIIEVFIILKYYQKQVKVKHPLLQ